MHLSELLRFDDIVIQCHDNPDADALASGFALYKYFTINGKQPAFIYRGLHQVQKSNLLIMINELNIPVTYEPEFDRVPELLINCDCQYGQKNVTKTKAQTIAVIDHHEKGDDLPELAEVRSGIGSCATVVWDMLRYEGIDANDDKDLSTALYYGLYTDTNRLSEVSHPLDRDMIDSLNIAKSLITRMSNSNISLEELELTGKAIVNYKYHEDGRYLTIKTEPCDPNILGVISDFAMETVEVDVCVAYYSGPDEIKFSVRSCTKEVHANELAEFLANGIGGGGGHTLKAGGTIRPEKLEALLRKEAEEEAAKQQAQACAKPSPFKNKMQEGSCDDSDDIRITVSADDIIERRLAEYHAKYEVIYAKDTTLDTSSMRTYTKKEVHLGTVKLDDVFPAGSTVEIRTLEGDVDVLIAEDTYLMIGIEGEIYPIDKAKLMSSYDITGFTYKREYEYEPYIKDISTGETKKVMPYAKTVISPPGTSRIFAKVLDHDVKVFTAWDEDKYYSGAPGDYIAVREDDPHDIYVISGKLFDELYKDSPNKLAFL